MTRTVLLYQLTNRLRVKHQFTRSYPNKLTIYRLQKFDSVRKEAAFPTYSHTAPPLYFDSNFPYPLYPLLTSSETHLMIFFHSSYNILIITTSYLSSSISHIQVSYSIAFGNELWIGSETKYVLSSVMKF